MSIQNQEADKKNCYEESLKKFSVYIYYIGGKLLYETLQANLKGILPSISTLYRFTSTMSNKIAEGEVNFRELNTYFNKKTIPKYIWVSEDATRITGKIEYDTSSNKLMGFVLPLKNGLPETNKYVAKSAKDIESFFQNGIRSNYAYTIMAQPLDVNSPSFCLSVFGTDNKFFYKDVLLRWKKLQELADEYGIKILGFSADGDTRLLKAMKLSAGLPTSVQLDSRPWYNLDCNENSICYLQDQIHVLTKLRTRLLKVNILLPMGNFFISVGHLHSLIETQSKDKHLLCLSDLAPEDKMNYNSAKKICDQKVIDLLSTIPNSDATKIYLKMMNFLIHSLIEKNTILSDRIYKIWYAIFMLRLWRNWVKNQPDLKMQHNFISTNCYTCIELNGHMLVKLVDIFKKDPHLTSDMFLPFLFNSQPCENFFRATRSMTSTFSTVVNYSIRDIINRADRISFINGVLFDLKEEFVFPRQKRKENLGNVIINPDLDGLDISEIINQAMEDALTEAEELGIDADRTICWRMDTTAVEPEHIELDDGEEEIIENELILDSEGEKDLFKDFLANDKELVSPGENIKTSIETDLDLKDYSDKNVDVSENGSYVKLFLPDSKTIVVKKSSYCWLLDEGNGRVSTDRLKRFIVNSKRKPGKIIKPKTKKVKYSGKPSINKATNVKKNYEYADSSTDSDKDEECITYDDSTDTETFDSDDDKVPTESQKDSKVQVEVEIFVDKYYAVQYDKNWYIGKIMQ